MGGLGDLVLTAGFLSSLRDSFVDATLVLVCRADLASVCNLFPQPPDQVIGLNFNPYEWAIPSGELFTAVEPALRQTEGVRADLFIAGEFQPTWFTWLLAAHANPRKAIQATLGMRPGSVLTGVLDHFNLDRVELEGPKIDTNLHEIQRYAEIVRFLGGTTHAAVPWVLPASIETQVQTTLQEMNLRSGEYLACFPLGAAGIGVKRWPKESYLRALAAMREKDPLPVLFTGDKSEAQDLRGFADALGGIDVHVYAGSPESIPRLAGLLLHSRAYLGNDTGPMHLASAFGVGGVAIYGGGHWPAYGPWGPGTVAMVHPLPCFGCNWDCLFGHGVCVESIRVEPVIVALRRVLAGEAEELETVMLEELPVQTNELIRDANRRYREAELDRGDRLSSIIELRRNVDSSHGRVEKLEEASANRLRALEVQHSAIEQLRHESDRRREGLDQLTALLDLRDLRIEELEEIANQRLVALESQAASYQELKRQADLRSTGLLELTEHVALRDRRIKELEEISVERYKALQNHSRVYEELRVEADKRTAGLMELTAHIAARDESISALVQEAEDRRQALEAQAAAYEQLRGEAEKRTAGLVELTAHIAARDESISTLAQVAEDRRQALEAQAAAYEELRVEAERRTSGLVELTAHIAARDESISTLAQVAEDRRQALEAQAVAYEELRVEAERRTSGLVELTAHIAARDESITTLAQVAEDRRQALEAQAAAYEQVRVAAEKRDAGLMDLTAHLATRDESIRQLTEIAEARVADHEELRMEAERRSAVLEQLTEAVAARDRQISLWVHTAAERLAALQQAAVAMGTLLEEAEKRAAGLQEFSKIVVAREAQLAEQSRISEERLAALLTTDEALRAVRADSEVRLCGLHELTSTIAAGNIRIEALESTAAERLDALLKTDAALQAEQHRVKQLLDRMQLLEKRAIEFEEEVTALLGESLYGFVSRRLRSR